MIARIIAFLLLVYALGFVLFAVTLGRPAKAGITADAIVVLTGGGRRIEHAVDLLDKGEAKRLLISGADPAVTKGDMAQRLGGKKRLLKCCVDLGSESVDTRSNAEEAKRWLDRRGYKTMILVTSDWHMRRARYEFRRTLGDGYDIIPDAVKTEPPLITLFAEYNKYLLRRLSVRLDI